MVLSESAWGVERKHTCSWRLWSSTGWGASGGVQEPGSPLLQAQMRCSSLGSGGMLVWSCPGFLGSLMGPTVFSQCLCPQAAGGGLTVSPCGLFSKSCWEHWLLAGLAGTWCSSCCRQLTEGTSHLLGKGLSLGWSSAAVQPSGSGFLQH